MTKQLLERQIDVFFRDITTFGGFAWDIIILLFLFFLGQLVLFFRFLDGIILVLLISVIIRHFYFKARPKNVVHTNWLERISASSFPSVHAARAWLFMVVFSDFFGTPLIAVILGFIAVLVCASRVWLEEHDFADVAFGSLLGILLGLLVVLFI